MSAPAPPRRTSRWIAVPIAFFLGAAIAATLLVVLDGGSSKPRRVPATVTVPVRAPAPAGSAQVTILLANEAREVQEQRLHRLQAKRLRIEAQLTARQAHVHRVSAHKAAAPATAATEASGGGVAAQSQEGERTSEAGHAHAERQAKQPRQGKHPRSKQKITRSQQRSDAKQQRESERKQRRETRAAEHEANGHEHHHAAAHP